MTRSSRCERLGRANFGDAGAYLEKFVERARHVEVQIFGDGGEIVVLGERDCSTQRRNQKVMEETPAPGISAASARAPLRRGGDDGARRELPLGGHRRVRPRRGDRTTSTSSR